MEHSDNKKVKLDGTIKKSGGFRPGAGRKEGLFLGIEKDNFTFRMPKLLRQEYEAKKGIIKSKGLDLTKMLVVCLRKELKKIPYPEGVQPVPEIPNPIKPVKVPNKVGRPRKQK